MDIDFSKKENREGYLQEKLDDLLDGINSSYGQSLLDELMSRLEITIEDFNKEVDDLMGSLKKSSEVKEKLIQQIKNGELPTIVKSSSQDSLSQTSESPEELSEWEKRLEGIN